MKMSHLALTDHAVLYGAVEFYNAATSVGIKPIIAGICILQNME